MKRRLLCLTAAATGGVLVVSACAGSTGHSTDRVTTISLVAADYGDTASNSSKIYWQHLASAFTARNPHIRVAVQVLSWKDIDSRVDEMIRSGHTPDILQSGGYADRVAQGLLYKAEDVLSIRTQGHFITSFARAGEVQHVQYGMPFVSSTRAFVYNKTLFAKAGITRPPSTWHELKEDAKRLKAKVPDVTPYALPLGREEAQAESLLWELGNDGGFTDGFGDYTLDSVANAQTFNWLRKNLVDAGLTYADPAHTDRKTAYADFAAGKVAMLNGHPSLIQMAQTNSVDYGVAPIPGRFGPLDTTLGVADWMMAFKRNGNREAIKKFLDFTYSRINALEFEEMYDLMPVTNDALDAMQSNGSHKDLKPFFDLMYKTVTYPLGKTSWDAVSADIRKNGGAAVERDPAKVLRDLQGRAERLQSEQ